MEGFEEFFPDESTEMYSVLYDALIRSVQLYDTQGFLILKKKSSGKFVAVVGKVDNTYNSDTDENIQFNEFSKLTGRKESYLTEDMDFIIVNETDKITESINSRQVFKLYNIEDQKIPFETQYRLKFEQFTHVHGEQDIDFGLPDVYNSALKQYSYPYLNIYSVSFTVDDEVYVSDKLTGVSNHNEINEYSQFETPENKYTKWTINMIVNDMIQFVRDGEEFGLKLGEFIDYFYSKNMILPTPRKTN